MEGQSEPKRVVDPPANVPEPGPELLHEVHSATSSDDEEKKARLLIWKIDLHILPFVVLLYLFSFLDRGE